ncbi:MAG TPA: PEP/pyruvate-binding domain-containing protein [Solirubrobacteraceae bacterium]|nr:PEP/pyruvate-binding domain-containing protein [Solirubrobacteraceae bacterium]
MSGHTRALSDLGRADEPEFGGKSAGLGELLAAGLPVPPGFALACAAYPGRDQPMPATLRDEVAARYAELGGRAAVAVRSSAIGEDSSEATFAGQQETLLGVRGVEPVCDAIRTCWASLYSDTAVAYRTRLGHPDTEPAMGVTVQEMVDPDVAGVLFTCNPVSGDRSMVAINASWGLGVAVVAGEVTPDDYLVSKVTGEVVRASLGSKAIEYVCRPGGTERRAVPDERRGAACLDAGAIEGLVAAARVIERHFGAPQDVEWAIADGELFLLQSRPVTAVRERPAARPMTALSLVMKTFGAGR